jgi:peptide/nickel transport system permease protein
MARSKNMILYIIKRILLIIPTVFLVVLVTFALTTMMNQNINLNQLGSAFLSDEIIAAELDRLGVNLPWYERVFTYFVNFFQGNWGTSYLVSNGIPVTTMIARIFPKTIELVIIPILVIPILSVKLGVISAKNMNNWKDTIVRGFMMIGVCVPVFWLATMIQYLISVSIHDLTFGVIDFEIANANSLEHTINYPSQRITGLRLIDGFLLNDQSLIQDSLIHIYLPVFCLIIVSLAGITRQTRASMLEVMQKDYVRTARAKGVSNKDTINKHSLRNALIPSSTAIVGSVAALITGSLFIEMSFNYMGMGYYMTQSIIQGDYVVVTGILFVSSLVILFGVLIADILYTIIDPRILYT